MSQSFCLMAIEYAWTHVTGFVVKACKWDASEDSCKEGEDMLTLNTKGGKNF